MIHPAWLKTCVYCGHPSTGYDHVLPWSKRRLADTDARLAMFKFLVACCRRCNGILGDRVFNNWVVRRSYVYQRYTGVIQWNQVIENARIVHDYLYQLENGKSIVQLDAEIERISGRSPPSYEMQGRWKRTQAERIALWQAREKMRPPTSIAKKPNFWTIADLMSHA